MSSRGISEPLAPGLRKATELLERSPVSQLRPASAGFELFFNDLGVDVAAIAATAR